MIIYKMVKTENSLLGKYDEISYWAVKPAEGTKIVKKGQNSEFGVLYAVEYDIAKDLTVQKILNIMFSEFSPEEAKQVCGAEPWLEKIFMCYLQNPINDEEFVKAIQSAKSSASGAMALSAMAILNG